MFRRSFALALLVVLCCACAPPAPAPFAAAPTAAPTGVPTVVPSATPAPSATPTFTPTPSATPTPTTLPSPTPTFAPILPTPTLQPLSAEERQEVFSRVWTLVRDRYVYPDYNGLDWEAIRAEYAERVAAAPSEEAFYDLMREVIARLDDDHSVFLSPQDVYQEDAQFDGTLSFGGIGVSVREVDTGALIVDVVRGGPAEEAGLQRRDVITRIGDVSVAESVDRGENPMRLARGEPGTTVQLTVLSPDGRERVVTVTRRVIDGAAFPSVQAEWVPRTNVGLVRIDTFAEQDVDQDVRAAIEQLLAAGPLDGLIVDVRDNGGGRLDYLLNTLALFLDGGDIGSDAGRNGGDTLGVPQSETLPALLGTPIAVLTGPDSVSAAEIFAAGMQARGRAVIVGEPTAGNTEVLITHSFPGGAEMRLAERAYRLPDGALIEGRGVQPDRLVVAEWWRYAPEEDPVVLAALEEIKKKEEAEN